MKKNAWQIASINDYANYRDQWDTINQNDMDVPVLNSAFFAYGLDNFSTGVEKLAILGSPDNPDALAIVSPRKMVLWDTFQPSQSPLGAWICKPEFKSRMEELLASLARALPRLVFRVGISQQDPAIIARPATSKRLSTLDYIETGRIDTRQTFDEYWQSRGKNLRHNMKRQKNRLVKEGVKTRLEVLSAPENVAQAIKDYGELESLGWKAEGNTAISPDNAQGTFYTALLEDFCRRGNGLIFRYFYDERLTACDLCVIQGGMLVILKTTYDEGQKTSSPAMLMRTEAFPSIFARDEITSIEFYGKAMDWHRKWTSDFRTLYHINYRALP